MSLIAKIQQESLLQNKLQAQLAEMSYQSLNGTRQSARNFREGTLEIGKMNFTTPQDRITKEMVMDYQKKEQEKHYVDAAGNALKYESTGLKDIANVEDELVKYVPIVYVPLGNAVTEDDIRDYKNDLTNLYNDLTMQTANLKRKGIIVTRAQQRLLIVKERVREMIDNMTEVGQEIVKHKEKFRDIEDEINAFKASATISASPGAPALLKRLEKEKSEEEATLIALVRRLRGVLANELVRERPHQKEHNFKRFTNSEKKVFQEHNLKFGQLSE